MNKASKRQLANIVSFFHKPWQWFSIFDFNWKHKDTNKTIILYLKDLNFSKGQYPRGGMSTLYLCSLKSCGDGSINL